MPVMRSSQMGEMYIQVAVEVPTNLTKRQRELLGEFDELSGEHNSPESEGFFTRMKGFFEGFAD